MRLSIQIRESDALASPAILGLARRAPLFNHVLGEEGSQAYLAVFPDVTQSIELAVLVIGELVNHTDVLVQIDNRSVSNLTKFWSALICYRDSLEVLDRQAYCQRQANRVGYAAGCPIWSCLARCPFICTRCHQLVRETGAPPVAEQLHQIARLAEVDWCPNLQLPEILIHPERSS